MSQTINRLFDNAERATQAAHELRNNRLYPFEQVHVFTRHGEAGAAASGGELSADEIVAMLMKAYVLKAHARNLAHRIQRGEVLVTVHAPFGAATTALDIFESHGAIGPGIAVDTRDQLKPWDVAAPCSSLLGLPVVLGNDQSFSRFWNVPALTRRGSTTSSKFGIPEISDSSGSYKGFLGLPLISHKAAPLSSMLGLPQLTKSRPRQARAR
jgi:hypothetical protein